MTFTFDLLDERPQATVSSSCVVPIDSDFKINAESGDFVLFSRECFKDG